MILPRRKLSVNILGTDKTGTKSKAVLVSIHYPYRKSYLKYMGFLFSRTLIKYFAPWCIVLVHLLIPSQYQICLATSKH